MRSIFANDLNVSLPAAIFEMILIAYLRTLSLKLSRSGKILFNKGSLRTSFSNYSSVYIAHGT